MYKFVILMHLLLIQVLCVGQIDLIDRVRVGITRDPPIIRLSSFLRSTDESSHLQNVTPEVGVSNKEGIISPFGLFPN